jgi:hypothetical protein
MIEINLLDHFLLIELKRKMFYRLQDVMFSEFNIVQDIYELARLIQLKENHYKSIDDVKFRKRSSSRYCRCRDRDEAAISRTMSITMISISINDKVEQIFVETTI